MNQTQARTTLKAFYKTRVAHDLLRIGVFAFALVASTPCSLHGAIFATQEAKDLVAQKGWSDAMITAGSMMITNATFELSGIAVRYVEPYSPGFPGVSTNTVRFQADLENLSSKVVGGVILEIVLTDVQSKRELLRKNIFLTLYLPPKGKQRLSRLYVDEDIDNAISAANPRWEYRLRFISQDPFLAPKPPKSWFGPGDALGTLRPVDHWDRFVDLR